MRMSAVISDAQDGDGSRQYLTFSVAEEHYAVDILNIQEIRGYVATTRLPNAARHVAGVLNLRGTIVPLYDLRSRFALPAIDYDRFNAIVVLRIDDQTLGIIVDRVSDVVAIADSEIHDAPDCQTSSDACLISGIANVGERLLLILEPRAVVSDDALPMALAA